MSCMLEWHGCQIHRGVVVVTREDPSSNISTDVCVVLLVSAKQILLDYGHFYIRILTFGDRNPCRCLCR